MSKLSFKIKTGDTVRVISGDEKGREGKIIKVLLKKQKVLVEGINTVTKHTKPSAQKPQGGLIKKEAPIHVSNVALIDSEGKTTKVGYRFENEKKVRYAKTSNQSI